MQRLYTRILRRMRHICCRIVQLLNWKPSCPKQLLYIPLRNDVFYFEYLVCLTLVMKKNLHALSYTVSSYEPHLI